MTQNTQQFPDLETLAETQINDLVDRHLEAMVREIQDRLGVETGDQAAWFFSGRWDDLKDAVSPLMQAYAQSEIELA